MVPFLINMARLYEQFVVAWMQAHLPHAVILDQQVPMEKAFTGTLVNFAKQFISQQGEAATAAKQLADGQAVVLNTLQKKVTDASGVNIDDEMAHLLALQNAYSANARVMSSIKQMYDTLMQAM